MSLKERFGSRLRRDEGLPLSRKLGKLRLYAEGRLSAPSRLSACDHIGLRARTTGRPVIENLGHIRIGHETVINSNDFPVILRTGPQGVIEAGDNLLVNFGATVLADRRVSMGERVGLGPHAFVCDHDDVPGGDPDPKPIVIGDDVWLTARVRVRKGAIIGAGAIIAAGAVVEGEIPPGAIAGGVPARVLRMLPPQTRPRIGSEGAPSGVPCPWHARARRLHLWTAGTLAGWRLRGVDRVGRRALVFGAPHVDNLGRITLGDDVRLHSDPVPLHLVAGRGAHIEIGNGVVMGPGSGLTCEARIRIEDGVELGAGVMVLDTDLHSLEDFNLKPTPAPITIGAGARLERHVTVLKGSHIGAGAWIAAGSVVSGEIPAGARAAGVPALVLALPPSASSTRREG